MSPPCTGTGGLKTEMGRFRFRNRNWNRNWHFFHVGGIGIESTTTFSAGIGIGIALARNPLAYRSKGCIPVEVLPVPNAYTTF